MSAAVERTTYRDVAGHFGKQAGKYDQGCQKVGWAGPEEVFRRLQILPQAQHIFARPAAVLDLGAGTGRLGSLFHGASGGNIHVTGVDIAGEMLEVAKAHERLNRVVHGDVTNLAWSEDSQFDAVTCCGVLDFLPDTRAFVAEVTRVLTPGGIFALTFEPAGTESDGHKTLQHARDVLEGQFTNHGAQVVRVDEVLGIYTNFKTGAPVRNDVMFGVLPEPEQRL